MKKQQTTNILKNINILISILVVAANIIAFCFCDANKTNFICISVFLNTCIFFIHWYFLGKELKDNINEIKREALYINYPLNIGTFFFCLLLVLIASAVCLFIVNKDALNLAFVFTFFMSIITMLFPSIILLVYIFFLLPAFILPGISSNQKNKKASLILFITLLILFIGFSTVKFVTYSIRTIYIDKQNKYKIIKLPIQYSTQYLKLKDISDYGKKKLSQVKVDVPFVYTYDSFNYKDYTSAELFCKSIGARIPNYLEMYNIAFNKFNTFGEKYYWTSNLDGTRPILIHFHNMSYNVEKYTGKEKPLLYCVANEKDNTKVLSRNYLYKNLKKDNNDRLEVNTAKPFQDESLKSILGKNYQSDSNNILKQGVTPPDINTDKKHVNFSVKEVSSDIMQELLQKGYVYSTQLKINTRYETNDAAFATQIMRDVNKKQMRLCYYPFTDYGSLNIFNESQIWKQSFCSPAFELIDPVPVIKTKYDKDSYCQSKGGRLPNIPELNGILKTLKVNNIGTKYWTNNKITDNTSDTEQPILVYYKDSRFMKVKALSHNDNDTAYTYCIKNTAVPSRVIANYRSRFKGLDGAPYAKAQCPKCQYYEVPDTILLSY